MRLLLIFFIFFTVYADAQINLPKSQFMQVSESKYRFNDSAVFYNLGYKEKSVRRYDSTSHIQTLAYYSQNDQLLSNTFLKFDKGYLIRKEERNECDDIMECEIYVNDTLGRKIFSRIEWYMINPRYESPTVTVALFKYDSVGDCTATINRSNGSVRH